VILRSRRPRGEGEHCKSEKQDANQLEASTHSPL
jgi:hypothetical protein